ncbi:MAG TPA: carbamoyl-phosphate synthase domain-containing protein, partial [Agriterribacter sp.]|nr:carbamoyl-phosphate synthase domain-containing protein [Agriterribacter sp.]
MSESKQQQAVLMLEDGNVFYGSAFGKIGTTTGEICFNTGMTGYQEVFTDPSYYGQVVIMNTAHVGNYGVKAADVESNSVKIKGLIARNLEEKYSRLQADNSLQQYLEEQQVVSIYGVDTRALVAHIRTCGAMNCIISSEITDWQVLKGMLSQTPSMSGLELASVVSTKEVYEMGNPHSRYRVAVYDYGVKKNILHCLTERGA